MADAESFATGKGREIAIHKRVVATVAARAHCKIK
jgi:hypothetical protein